ncbi:hypothetical protein [Neisseria dentiae]|uniref:hypothetical protein n=1 Tax=Neisseria dentiae TaxID=194197 RepID=UPI0035A1C7A4
MQWFKRLFPDYPRLPKSGKFLAWLTLLQGTKWPLEFAIHKYLYPEAPVVWWGILISLAVTILTLLAAWNVFKYRLVGLRQMLAVYGLAVIQIWIADKFFFNFSGVLALSLGYGSDNWQFKINFLALFFIWLVYKNIEYMKSEPTPAGQTANEHD